MGKELTQFTPTEMVARANQAGLFPQSMTAPQRAAIAKICIDYELDPLMNELMVYQGRPYITVAARLRKAHENDMPLAGITTRAATKEEKLSRDYTEADYVMVAEAFKMAPTGQLLGPFEGWGVVKKATADKADKHLPIGDNPAQHAEKRAIARALRMGWHIPLPSFEEIGTDNGTGTPVFDAESEATELPPEPKPAKPKAQAAKPAPTETKAEVKEPAAATEVPAGIPTTSKELYEWAYSHGKSYVPSWVDKNVGGVEDKPEDVERAYHELKEITGWES